MNTRNFTVKGTINYFFSPHSGSYYDTIDGIEVQLWHQSFEESVFLGKGNTNENGEYNIEFQLESPSEIIVNGKINNVFIKTFYNGEAIETFIYDSDAQLYFEQLSPEPSTEFKLAVNGLVFKLKQDGNWTKLDRLWIHATEYQQHATISLVNPGSDPISEVGTPIWNSGKGYMGNGSSMYLNSNFNLATDSINYAQNSASLFVFSRTDSDGTKKDIGLSSSGSSTISSLNIKDSGNFLPDVNDWGGSGSIANPDSLGFFVGVRTNSTTQQTWKNGVQLGSDITVSSTALGNLNIYILAINSDGSPAAYSDRELAISGLGSGSIGQSTFFEALNAFATIRGFNI